MAEESDAETVLDLLGDPTVRAILVATNPGPVSAREIAEDLAVAPSTVYRHLDDLHDAGFLVEQIEIEADGSHDHVYRTNVDRVEVAVDEAGFDVRVQVSRSPSERFAQMWDDIRQGT